MSVLDIKNCQKASDKADSHDMIKHTGTSREHLDERFSLFPSSTLPYYMNVFLPWEVAHAGVQTAGFEIKNYCT